jgi:DUF971 family protein
MPTATSAGKTAVKASKIEKVPTKADKTAKAVEKVVEKPAKVEKAAAVEKPAPPVVEKLSTTGGGSKGPLKGPPPMDFDAFLAKLTPKDRLNIERHLTAIEELSTRAHAKLWKRIAAQMMTMASHSAKANGQQSMQFYIQDGKYRMQIFALEDLRDGTVHVYCTDALDEAIAGGALQKPKAGDEPDQLRIPGSTDLLNVERMDGKVSNPAPFYKDMLGWNRRALHVALPAMASEAQIAATELLLVHGAKKAGALK